MKTNHAVHVVLLILVAGLSQISAATLSVLSDSGSPFINTGVGFPPGITLPIDGGDGVNNVGGASLQSANPGSQLGNAVFVLQLPNLGALSNPFSDASFTATINSSSGASAFSFNPGGNNYDLYGLGARASSTVLASDFFAGASDGTNATLIQNQFAGVDFSYTTYGAGAVKSTGSSTNLINYLNTQYAGGANAGNYVFLRINSNFNVSSFSDLTWRTNSETFLDYTAVPEPSTWALLLIGSGLVFFGVRRRHPGHQSV